jgi:hypothetical protein
MTREDVAAWLAARAPRRPRELDDPVRRAVAECAPDRLAGCGTMADAMALLGLEMLARVTGSGDPQAPGLALYLLAADAFVTYAFEAAAEEDVPVEPLVCRLLEAAA